jgi:hypothetical protein
MRCLTVFLLALLGTVALAAAPAPARAKTVSVQLVVPPVVGRSPLTVRVTTTGAEPSDQYQLFLTRSGCPTPRGLGNVVPAATFDSIDLTEPPPYLGTTFTELGGYTICGYLGHNNYGSRGEPLPPTIDATAAQAVTARDSVVSFALTRASYDQKRHRLKLSATGSAEADALVRIYRTRPGGRCPAKAPRPNTGSSLQVLVHNDWDLMQYTVGGGGLTPNPHPGTFHQTWTLNLRNELRLLRGRRYRICGYLAVIHAQAEHGAASDTRQVRVGSEPNHRPVARSDRWAVRAGLAVDENVLDNDSDPDGDDITAKIIEISFASKEWSGLDRDGGFLYTAGPGTRGTLTKKITYEAVDSHGKRSKPVVSTVTVVPTKLRSAPFAASGQRAVAAAAGTWDGPWASRPLCFGRGLQTECWFMLSVARTSEFAAVTSWLPTLANATNLCTRYGFVPVKAATCAKKLIHGALPGIWDTAVVRGVAGMGDCLLYRVSRHRTLRHPRAGVWGSPEFSPIRSYVTPYNGQGLTGWGRWNRGLTGRWRIPLFCAANGNVYGDPTANLSDA